MTALPRVSARHRSFQCRTTSNSFVFHNDQTSVLKAVLDKCVFSCSPTLPDLPCSSYLRLYVLRFIGFLWGWHWGCWKTGASSRNKAELCFMHVRRRFCFQQRRETGDESSFTHSATGVSEGRRRGTRLITPHTEKQECLPFPREQACRDEILRERDANDKYSRNWRRILNPTPAAASQRAVTMVANIIRLSLVTLDIQKYTFFPSFCLCSTSILCSQ